MDSALANPNATKYKLQFDNLHVPIFKVSSVSTPKNKKIKNGSRKESKKTRRKCEMINAKDPDNISRISRICTYFLLDNNAGATAPAIGPAKK